VTNAPDLCQENDQAEFEINAEISGKTTTKGFYAAKHMIFNSATCDKRTAFIW